MKIFKIKINQKYKYLNNRMAQVTLYNHVSSVVTVFWRKESKLNNLEGLTVGTLCVYSLTAFLGYCSLYVPRFTDCVSSFNQNSTHKVIKSLKKILAKNLQPEAATHDAITLKLILILLIQTLP